jgi:hypothetical protein
MVAGIQDVATRPYSYPLQEEQMSLSITESADIETLVVGYAALRARMEADSIRLGKWEHQIIQAMDDQGATILDHPTQHVSLRRPVRWDKPKLDPIRELVPPGALEGAYYPRHEVTTVVEATWNMVKTKSLSKYGRDVQAILEGAQFEGAPKLSITPKE